MKRSLGGVLDTLETWLGATVFAAMFGAILLQVFFRYVLGDPLVWPFEFSVYCYIYIIYIGSVMATKNDTHVSFGIVFDRFPERVRLITGVVTNLFIAIVFLSLIPSSIGYIRLVGGVPSSALGIPWGVVLAAFPFGMGLMALTLVLRAADNARQLKRNNRHVQRRA